MKRSLVSAFLCAVLLAPLSLSAQEIPVSSTSAPEAVPGTSLESCFDYYQFNSVPVTISSDSSQIIQGASLPLHITVTNTNSYPLKNVSVLGKVFYKKDFSKTSYGPDVIQLLTLGEHIDLKAGESRMITYAWDVPPQALPGNYQIAGYVNSYNRFNFAGLPFTNDVVGTLYNFQVVGIDQGYVRFDNAQTEFSGSSYHSATFSPQSDPNATSVPITATIVNERSKSFAGTVHWQLFSWDGSNPANLITESTSPVDMEASSTATVDYAVTDTKHTVYYVLATLQSTSGESLSVLPIRYVLSRGAGLDAPRLAFFGAATSTNPASTKELRAFACVHSTGRQPSKYVKVEVSAVPLDPVSWLLHLGSLGHTSYSGSVPGSLSAISVPLAAADGDFKVKTNLYQNGKLVDSLSATYSCSEFNSCSSSKLVYALLFGAGLLIIILCLVFLLRRHRAHPSIVTSQPNV